MCDNTIEGVCQENVQLNTNQATIKKHGGVFKEIIYDY
jgi:hypothetical protein